MRRSIALVLALAWATFAPLASHAADPSPDADGDGIPDVLDKCTLDSRNAAAPATCDDDGDGYGNVCDPDFDQTLLVDSADFAMLFVPALEGADPAPWPQGMDMDCSGAVTQDDFDRFFAPKFKNEKSLGGAVPGPSGLPCAGTPGCK